MQRGPAGGGAGPARVTRRGAVHAAQAGETGVVLVDSAPVGPGLADGVRLGLVFEEIGDLADQGAEGVRGGVGEESEEGVDEPGGGEGAGLVGGDVRPESAHLGGVVAEEVGGALDHGVVADEASAVGRGEVGLVGCGGWGWLLTLAGRCCAAVWTLGCGCGTAIGGVGRGGELAAEGAVGDGLGGMDGHLPLEGDFISPQRLCRRAW